MFLILFVIVVSWLKLVKDSLQLISAGEIEPRSTLTLRLYKFTVLIDIYIIFPRL